MPGIDLPGSKHFYMQQKEWYIINNLSALDSPALAVYPQRINANIKQAIRIAGSPDKLRPHVKTSKIAEVNKLLLQAGITRFKCATIAEAEMLAQLKAPDVLLAYQPVGPKINRLLQLTQSYPRTRFSCLADNEQSAAAIAAVFSQHHTRIGIFIDLNIGMNRTGIRPGKEALQLYLFCMAQPSLDVIGLHAYDGHIHDSDPLQRKQQTDAAFLPVAELAGAIHDQTSRDPVIVAGGTPTFPIHAQRDQVECSPGTFVFWDWNYQQLFPDEQFVYAAVLVTRVISVIDAQHICLDLGHKSVAAENPLPRVHFLNQPDAQPISQSEEHLVVKVASSSDHAIGDVWYGIPVHICPTVALYNTVSVVEQQEAREQWKVIARDRFIHI